jgi:hypothetical protein
MTFICFSCQKELEEVHGNVSGGVSFDSIGNYGSAVHDEGLSSDPIHLEIVVCDSCLTMGQMSGWVKEFRIRRLREQITPPPQALEST